MAKARKKTKPRNRMAQDVNLINLRALKKKVAMLDLGNYRMRQELAQFEYRLAKLEARGPIETLPA